MLPGFKRVTKYHFRGRTVPSLCLGASEWIRTTISKFVLRTPIAAITSLPTLAFFGASFVESDWQTDTALFVELAYYTFR